jgi:CheY-like chemotaxis protein
MKTYVVMLKYKKIALVDDDMDDRQIFKEILLEIDPDAIVECAENGLEMVAMLNKKPDDQLPEMIILDQNMPRMTGKESLIFLKESSRFKAIPVIIYSTYQIKDFYTECLGLGAQNVVSKPDSLQAYREMIEQLLVAQQPPTTSIPPPSPSSEAHIHLPKP